ncbi:MAG: hypothetical protein M1117_04345 [Candidatus Thermoplasmatota archaeon]|nr:hypothetical protein [Candidatus Thermoplasmatota archaeon]
MAYILYIEALISALTLLVSLTIAYRAYRVYSIARNTNLLLLSFGFLLLAVYFIIIAVQTVVYRRYLPDGQGRFLLSYIAGMVEVSAYLVVMLAYVVRPKMEDVAVAAMTSVLLFLTFQLFILIILFVVVLSVWRSYRMSQTASTALVLSSFMLLLVLHLINALLLFSPRSFASGYIYYSVFQLLSFVLLYMAVGLGRKTPEERGKVRSA